MSKINNTLLILNRDDYMKCLSLNDNHYMWGLLLNNMSQTLKKPMSLDEWYHNHPNTDEEKPCKLKVY